MHADSAEFLGWRVCRAPAMVGGRYIWGGPNSGLAGFASCGNAEIAGCADHDFFEHTHVPDYIASNSGEVEDRVADNLARSVIGDVATAAGFVKLDALLAQHVFA